MKTATVTNGRIELAFPYNDDDIVRVRGIEGRRWDDKNMVWWLPATAWHAHEVMREFLQDFQIDPSIRQLAKGPKLPPKRRYLEGMYDFQKKAVDFTLATGGRCIIADEMGTGKTVEALGYIAEYGRRTLIVAPTNVVYKWQRECEKWVPDRKAQVLKNGKTAILKGTDFVIMSYGLLPAFYEQLNRTAFDVLVCDEAHYCKNYKAQRTRLIKGLVQGGIPKVLFLSGTPFLNHPGELFSLLNMLDPASYSNYFSYAARYCGAYRFGGAWVFPPLTVTNEEEFRQRLEHIMIRRTKTEVMKELPALERTVVPVALPNMAEYRTAKRGVYPNALAKLTNLRHVVGRGKVKPAVELAEDILQGDRQVVMFCHHKDILEELEERLSLYGVGVISGDTPARERDKLSEAFVKEGSRLRVMLITTAGREGIDLYSASDIIFVEREWTPAWEEQAEARLHRSGQKNAVTAHYLVAKDTVDEKLDDFVRAKRKVVGTVISQADIINELMEEL